MTNIDYSKLASDFIDKDKSNYPTFSNEHLMFIIIDKNNNVRYSKDINLLNTCNVAYRIINIHHISYKGYFEQAHSSLYYNITDFGDIHSTIMYKDWEIDFRCRQIKSTRHTITVHIISKDLTVDFKHYFDLIDAIEERVGSSCYSDFINAYKEGKNLKDILLEYKVDKITLNMQFTHDKEIEAMKKTVDEMELKIQEIKRLLKIVSNKS